jgi:4-hydroxy-tetrahydrodipicolinate synthase
VKRSRFTCSTFACVITTFASDASFDELAMGNHLKRIGQAGVGVYLGSSSPGEGYSLSIDETDRLYAVGAEVLKGVVPVRAMGVEPRSASDLLELVRLAEFHKLDAMQLYCLDLGHSNRPSEAELERYFRDVLDRMAIPALLSSHIFGGYAIPIPMIDRLLSDYPDQVIGINCTNPDFKYLAKVLDVACGRAEVHVGGPMQALSVLAMGGQGFLSSEANIAPSLCQGVIEGFQSGDLVKMMDSYDKLIRIFGANQSTSGSARWTKAAMKVLGLAGWNFRLPLLPLDDVEVERVAEELLSLGIQELSGPGPDDSNDTAPS